MIDVIIPAYNCKKTLDRTLSSLVAQTNKDFIVTVIDDCSSEDLLPNIERYKELLDISYIRNDENKGCGMSRQVGIDNTCCSHFTFLDSDDVFMPYTIDTFNSIIEANPDVELIHSYIYKQDFIDGNPALTLIKDGFSYCHGKLYNRELVNRFNVRNSPLVKWHDDSYFNSMCMELFEIQVIGIPTILWCFNSDSVTRKSDIEREKMAIKDFLNAMCMSKDYVIRYKNNIEHIPKTIENVIKGSKKEFDEEEKKLLEYLKGE